jgi:hypothetical protein
MLNKVHKTMILSVDLHLCETWSLTAAADKCLQTIEGKTKRMIAGRCVIPKLSVF